MAPSQTNKDLVRRHFDAVNQQDWERCAETLAADIVFHQAGESHRGIEWYTDHLKDFYATIPDATITIDDMLAEDDRVAVRITNTGTHNREHGDNDPNNTEIEFSSQLIGRVEDGALAEMWVVAEQFRLMQQLGAIESPGE